MWEHEEEILGARGLTLKCIEIKEVKTLKFAEGEVNKVRLFIMEGQ